MNNKIKFFNQSRMNVFLDNMVNAFGRVNCGYYDGEGKHGGPDPNPEINFNGRPRNRRETPVDDELYIDFDENDAREYCDEFSGSFFLFKMSDFLCSQTDLF